MARVGSISGPPELTDAALRGLVGYRMKRAFNVLQADLARTLAPFGLRMLTYSALALIARNPGLRSSQLAAALSVERANVVAYVDQLEEAGWVTRMLSPDDGRAHALQCTLAGRQIYEQANKAVVAHDSRMLDGLSGDEVAVVRKALDLIEARG